MTSRHKVRAALKVPSIEIEDLCRDYANNSRNFSYAVRRTSELDHELQAAIWSILEANMRPLAEASSMGWVHEDKYAETFDPLSRFILVYADDDRKPEKLIAFALFRFDKDFDDNVVYCYEVQVKEGMRGQGLGRTLMSLLTHICSRWGMDKVMLTVLKSNVKATRLYSLLGFTVDETSPDPEDGEDYEILSKYVEVED